MDVIATVRQMCSRLHTYSKEEVDGVLTPDTLKQCDYATLALLAFTYFEAFGSMHFSTQVYMEGRAWQSPRYRQFRGSGSKSRRRGMPMPASADDPLALLKGAAVSVAVPEPETEPVSELDRAMALLEDE